MGDMGVDEAREKVLAMYPDASSYHEEDGAWSIGLHHKMTLGEMGRRVGWHDSEDKAWVAAAKLPALRPVEEMEIDWESHEAVVRAAEPDVRVEELGHGYVIATLMPQGDWGGHLCGVQPTALRAWEAARNMDNTIVRWERKQNPKYAAVPEPAPTPSEPDTAHQSQMHPQDNKFHKGNGQDGKHYWLTPPELYAELDAKHHFDFDPCPFPKPEDFDGLTSEWGQSSYVNPPFGSIMHEGKKKGPTAWARKAIAEQQKGKSVVLVYPIDKWVLMLIAAGAKISNLGDVRWLATEDRSTGKGTGRHIACFVLEPQASEPDTAGGAVCVRAGCFHGKDYHATESGVCSYPKCGCHEYTATRATMPSVKAAGQGASGDDRSNPEQILRYVMDGDEPSAGTGWLIEKGQLALGSVENKPAWVSYLHPGVFRFARERDAVGMLWALRSYGDDGFSGCYVSEHRWGFDEPASQPSLPPVEGSDGLPPLDVTEEDRKRLNTEKGVGTYHAKRLALQYYCRERQLRAALARPTVEEVGGKDAEIARLTEERDALRSKFAPLLELDWIGHTKSATLVAMSDEKGLRHIKQGTYAIHELATLKARSGGGFEEWYRRNQKYIYYSGAILRDVAQAAWDAALSTSPQAPVQVVPGEVVEAAKHMKRVAPYMNAECEVATGRMADFIISLLQGNQPQTEQETKS